MEIRPTYEELEKQIADLKVENESFKLNSKSDISESREKEQKLNADEEIFKQLIKNSFDMVVLLDANGNQHFVSESCKNILGYQLTELINIPVIERMIHPEDQEKTILEFQKILNNSGTGGIQYRHRHKNGHWIYLEAFGTNQLENPSINSIVLNVRDVSDRKKAIEQLKSNEVQLKELNATKDKFFSIIAHDLRSPFNSVVGFSDLIADQVRRKDYEGLERYATIIQNSSQLALDLLTNLLEWSRSQTGRMEFNPEYFELISLINELTHLFREIANQKSIQISTNLPNYIPVYADRAMLSTILRNLISNSIKFSNPDSEIKITVQERKNHLELSVIDNGIGINPEDIHKLFRIAEGFSSQGTQNEKGTGLGLILCREFVEKHEGKIWVESEEGKGSIFRFTLPNQH